MNGAVKHTPGPWIIRTASHGLPYQIWAPGAFYGVPGRVGKSITRWGAISLPSSDEGKANARLIAAAPDMLDALELALSVLAGELMTKSALIEALQKGRAAIAKATGATP